MTVPSIALLAAVGALAMILFLRWGTRWGSTAAERARQLAGDAYLADGPRTRVAMTRAISIDAPPETVWPWLCQLGRGAGWYSIDLLDNGNKTSAEHIVSWIPAPRLGDASPIGYLRHSEPGRELVWWVKGTRFSGAHARLVVDIRLDSESNGCRLVTRMSADAAGLMGPIALLVFRFIDTIMARRQLLEIRERAERHGARTVNPDRPETGARDQYQLYEALYASGESAGVAGHESAARWRATAIEDGVLEGASDEKLRAVQAVTAVEVPPVSWRNLDFLPPEQIGRLREIAARARGRSGGSRDDSRGEPPRAQSILLTGPAEVGKQMAAAVLASELTAPLYRVDLSRVVSKYIGETEKNLTRILEYAASANAILFFDEADALFGKRSEADDAHDRYANLELGHLLDRLEATRGPTILCADLRDHIDPAFVRRFRFVVHFPQPDPQERERLW